MEIFLGWGQQIAHGVFVTLQLALLALFPGILWGLLGASAKLSTSRFLRGIGTAYTALFRSVPELLIIFILYYGGTVTLTTLNHLMFSGGYVEISPLIAGIFALSLVFGSYATENIRGAILVIPQGPLEAAVSIGLSRWTIFYHIQLPHIWRYALPALGNNWISLLKDTSLVSIIGVEETMRVSALAIATTHQPFRFYMIAAIIYLFFTFINSIWLHQLERYLARSESRSV